ncbi:MAG: DNA recombination protein RmuC [Comamonas sp.]
MSEWSVGVWLLVGVALGGLLGAVAGYLLGAARTRQHLDEAHAQALATAVDAAVDQAVAQAIEREQALAATASATLQERLRGLQEERAQLQQAQQQQTSDLAGLRASLDAVRDERAQLAERAAQVPALEEALAQTRRRVEDLHETGKAVQARAAALEADNQRLPGLVEQLDTARRAGQQAAAQVAELQTRLDAEQRQAQEKIDLLRGARDDLSNQFKALANDILEEKSKRFTEQNQSNLGQLLDPLRTRLHEFQGKVEQFYVAEGQQRSALEQQVRQLMQLNQMLSDDARNLTQALKGSAKSQGNWGELILERVLEASGLRRGMEYDVQESHVREDGSRVQPDVVVHLPEDRHLVVDAKVSLLAYDEFVNAADEATRAGAQRRHLDSVRAHIKGLSSKNYQQLYGLKSLDFVLMFVPIEPAFMTAIAADGELFMDAWNRNVLLVSPSTLLFVVRTVAHLWRQEAQTRNAQDIAKRGAELYDRLVAFTADLEKVGERLRQAQDSYTSAYDKLARRKGNVIRQAEMLRMLGVKPTKRLSKGLVESAIEDDSLPPEAGDEAGGLLPAAGDAPGSPAAAPSALDTSDDQPAGAGAPQAGQA